MKQNNTADKPFNSDEQFFRLVLTSLEEYVIFTTDIKGNISSWNAGAERITGYNEKEILGKSAEVFFTPEDQKERKPQKELHQAAKYGRAVDERWHVKKNGSTFWASGLVFPLKDDHGRIRGFTKIARDITVRKKLDWDITQKEKRFRLALKAGRLGVWDWDIQQDRVEWTDKVYELHGMKKGQFGGDLKSFMQLVHPKDIKHMSSAVKKALEDLTGFTAEFRVVHPDGTIHWLTTDAEVIEKKNGKALRMLGATIDITDRKQSEINTKFLSEASKILSSSLDFQKTFNNIAKIAVPRVADWCGVSMLDEKGNIQQVAIAHVNPKKVKWAKELNKANPPDMTSRQGLPQVIRSGKAELYPVVTDAMLVAAARNKKELSLLRELNLTSVMIVPICKENQCLGGITFIISESKRTYTQADLIMAEELASRASLTLENARLYQVAQDNEKKFKGLFNANIVGVHIEDLKGNIKEANDAFLKMVGYTRKELEAGKINIYSIIVPEFHAIEKKAIEDLKTKGYVTPQEKEIMKRDGSQIPVVFGKAIADKKSGLVVTFVLDITERKRLEQRKDEFIGIASHELKTPLTSIKGYIQILERIIEEMGDKKAKALVSKTNTYINRLNSLITDLLDVSKIQAGKLQFNNTIFQLNTLIDDAIEAVKPTSQKHEIICEECPKVRVYGDQHRLEQVLVNLLSNAIKYSPKAKKIIVRAKKTGSQVMVSVTDFGIGIPKSQHSKLFQRFFRIEKISTQFSGLGIGLYISSEIVQRHGGKIWVKSREHKGSTFSFTLPIHNTSK